MMFFTIHGNKNLMVEKKDSQILLDGIDEIAGAARRDRPCLRQETTIVDGQRPSTKIIVADSRGYTQNLKKDKTPDHL